MFEMYAEPEAFFRDITRYFEKQGIKVYGTSLLVPVPTQLGLCTERLGNV